MITPKYKVSPCGCTDLKFMKQEAEKNWKSYCADMEEVPERSKEYWKVLDYPKFWPPHLQKICNGVTKRIGICGEVMDEKKVSVEGIRP